jgi:hypothetical protein
MSFNINKLVQMMAGFMDWTISLLPGMSTIYNPTVRYFPGDVCFVIDIHDDQHVQTWYQRTAADAGGTVGVPPTDPTRWQLLREFTALSSHIEFYDDISFNDFLDTGTHDFWEEETVADGPVNDQVGVLTGPFMLKVYGDIDNYQIICQDVLYRETGLGYTRTMTKALDGTLHIIQDWYKTKDPVWDTMFAGVDYPWALRIQEDGQLYIFYQSEEPPQNMFIFQDDPTHPWYGMLVWQVLE